MVVQEVLLYGSETWVMTPHIGSDLDGLQYRVYHRMTVWQPRRGVDGRWRQPLLAEAMRESGLKEVETYIYSLQNTVANFIATSTIVDLCLEAERRPGPRAYMWWWDQECL